MASFSGGGLPFSSPPAVWASVRGGGVCFKGGKWGSFNRKLRYMTPSSQAFISILKNLSQSHVFVEIGRKDLQRPLG
jgi:hypothetical protein